MLSLIEVTCPHCGAHGQIMLPPVGTIIVGPCPECQGLVVVFCGHVLALKKETMLQGTSEEKREHMLSVLTEFLKERVNQMIGEETVGAQESPAPSECKESLENASVGITPAEQALAQRRSKSPITNQEFTTFANVELKLLDNKDYFKSIFG